MDGRSGSKQPLSNSAAIGYEPKAKPINLNEPFGFGLTFVFSL
jgi:hypothetical protein